MLKKIVLGGLLVALIGVLAVGAVIRTVDKTGNVAEARGQGSGRNADAISYVAANGSQTRGGGYGAGGGGGQGRAVSAGVAEPLSEAPAPEDWIVYEGTVVEAPAAGVDMVLQTADGEELLVGTGPGYLETQGFALQTGEQVQVKGFWEDGEFKAGELTRLRDGETVLMRDTYGRPAWSGGYGRGVATTAGTAAGTIEGQGPGTGPSRGQGGISGQSQNNAPIDVPGDGTGTGQAQVDEWVTLSGSIQAVNADEMIVLTRDGQEIVVDGRAWRFAQEQGFTAQVMHSISLTGFYEDGDFEVGQIDDLSTGKSVSLRDTSGRPLWAGRGGRTS
ncbi:MAG: hypothetical protein ACK2UC_05450 [Anaerolineae bacterium]|jgi:hypothetical protein